MLETDNPMAKGAAWIDGAIMPIRDASLPLNDWGLIHSDITYDVVPVRDGGFFRIEAYVARFQRSITALRLDIGMDSAAIIAVLHAIVAASGLQHAYVAMVASRGVPLIPGTRDPRDCGNHFFAWCVPYVHVIRQDLDLADHSAWIAKSVHRIPAGAIDPRIKNYQWGDFTAGLFEAKDNGAETVILLDEDGNVTEGPGFNVFAVKNGRVVTSDHGMLAGITRQTILELCETHQIPLEIRPLPLAEFMDSDEIFISTSGGGVFPLTRIDDRIFNNGATGPITESLHQHYWALMQHPAYRTEIKYPTKLTG